ncbi:hypothetical protein [Methylobacterium sp. WCS2018Hpa-22]|uniref:hypothetical protein n=1 Tax=Methylobacterium sp. WCS2018Hpa-22 TaxID=3073633 RepID=UPI00288C16D6|nr:hypothetical protein [Methylobacterium sp. WCS2018Hpa-22]
MTMLKAKEAISIAKGWIEDVFGPEHPSNIGLEEVKFDDRNENWLITVGFSRPWNSERTVVTAFSGEKNLKRSFKVVTIKDSTGEVQSVTNRSSDD